jgi:hypothetical protein
LDNCDDLASSHASYCVSDASAFKDCHKTCGFCGTGVTEPEACDPPPSIPHASQIGASKETYTPGESVEFKCDSVSVSQTRYCMTDGTWSGTDEMCGGRATLERKILRDAILCFVYSVSCRLGISWEELLQDLSRDRCLRGRQE